MLKCKKFKSKFTEIEARKEFRVINMAFFTSKEVNGLQEFGNSRKCLYFSSRTVCLMKNDFLPLTLIGRVRKFKKEYNE